MSSWDVRNRPDAPHVKFTDLPDIWDRLYFLSDFLRNPGFEIAGMVTADSMVYEQYIARYASFWGISNPRGDFHTIHGVTLCVKSGGIRSSEPHFTLARSNESGSHTRYRICLAGCVVEQLRKKCERPECVIHRVHTL